jgi:hypothetical protein
MNHNLQLRVNFLGIVEPSVAKNLNSRITHSFVKAMCARNKEAAACAVCDTYNNEQISKQQTYEYSGKTENKFVPRCYC